MTEDRGHTLSGLVAKRAELTGRIAALRSELRQLLIDLSHVDASIRIFDPEYDVAGIRPKTPVPPDAISFRGEFVRIILDKMREVGGPVTTPELALHLMQRRGINSADPAQVNLYNRRTRALLNYYSKRGMVRGVPGNEPGRRRFNWWELAV